MVKTLKQADIDAVKPDENGIRHFERCRFAEGCSFEKIGEAFPGQPYLGFHGFGSRTGSKVYFWNLKKGIYVRAGCYLGTLAQFKKKVSEKYGKKHEYLDLCKIVEKKLKP